MSAALVFRPLVWGRDDAAVLGLMQRARDYVQLEGGRAPDAAKVAAFFTDCVPGGDLAQAVKLGLEEAGQLCGVAEMSFGYPEAGDAYIGLVMLDAAARGRGLGKRAVAHLEAIARQRGATRMLVAVLKANPKGLAFWQREGFALEKVFPPQADDPLQHSRFRMTRAVSPA
jgi:GNAT superfamily N-acetyltransferase